MDGTICILQNKYKSIVFQCPERPRHRWMDNIKMGLLEIGLSVVD
jgi:hypothetical protein